MSVPHEGKVIKSVTRGAFTQSVLPGGVIESVMKAVSNSVVTTSILGGEPTAFMVSTSVFSEAVFLVELLGILVFL